jgi:hypothetical protein
VRWWARWASAIAVRDVEFTTALTTPDPVLLQQQFRRVRGRRCHPCLRHRGVVHWPGERRLDGTARSAWRVFTNFTQDHLDYHGSMATYWEAKAELFDRGRACRRPWSTWIDAPGQRRRCMPALPKRAGWHDLDLWSVAREPARPAAGARDIGLGAQGLRFTVLCEGQGESSRVSYVLSTHLDRSSTTCQPAGGAGSALRALGVPIWQLP